jgi:Flp pilus assembly protein TadB
MSFGTANRSRIEPRPEFAKIVRIDDSYAAPDSVSTAAQINGRFDRLIIQSGTSTAPGVVLRLCMLAGITCGGTIFVATENLLGTAAGLAVGALLPITALASMRMQRQRILRRQLSVLNDGLLEAARQGRGLAVGLESAAADIPAPLADEIGLALRRLRMGVDVAAAFADLPDRTGLPAMSVLVTALAHHDRTGCDLVPLLERTAKRISAGV